MSVDTAGRETVDAAEAGAKAFTETALFEGLARVGYLSRGVIYALIGLLAIRLADGVAAPRPNQQGAMQQIAQQRYGHLLLLLTAIGLGGYALWRLAQALIGHTPEYGKHSALDRIGAAGSFAAYATFFVLAITVLRGTGGNSSAQPRKTTAGVLQWPAGRELVAAAGLLFVGIACYQAYLGLSRKFLSYSKTGQMSESVLRTFTIVGVVGLLARGDRLRADRNLRPEGRARLFAAGCRRHRRSARPPAPALLWPGRTRGRRRRPDRVRRLFDRRRALPQDLASVLRRRGRSIPEVVDLGGVPVIDPS